MYFFTFCGVLRHDWGKVMTKWMCRLREFFEQVMSVVVSPLNVFRASCVAFCHDDWRLLSRWSHFVELLCNFVDFNEWCVKFLQPLVIYYGLLNKIQASTVRMVATFSKVFRKKFIIFCQNFGAIRLFFHHISWNFHAILIDLIAIRVLSFIICHVLWSFEASKPHVGSSTLLLRNFQHF